MTNKSRFKPKHPEKYAGDANNIICRSSWERKVCKYLDENSAVLQWSSEELAIPYISPMDGRWHRYFPDFIVKIKTKENKIQTMILEVKPKIQTKEPVKPKKRTKRYLTEVATWGINQAKWKAATEFCEDRKWIFKLITEDELGI